MTDDLSPRLQEVIGRMPALAAQLCKRRELAQELAQEGALAAILADRAWREDGGVSWPAWVWTKARQKMLNALRTEARTRMVLVGDEAAFERPGEGATPEDLAIGLQEFRILRDAADLRSAAMLKLPLREQVVLKGLETIGARRLGIRLGLSRSVINKLARRARARLHQLLNPEPVQAAEPLPMLSFDDLPIGLRA